MITPGADLKVYVATRPVDFRKGHDGLAALVGESGLIRSVGRSLCSARNELIV